MPPTQLERQYEIVKQFCIYLLVEKKQETQLSMAFSMLVQERHNEFHTDTKDRKNGDGTDFSDCQNELCRTAYNILKDSRSMSVEMNDLTLQLTQDWNLNIRMQGLSCRAFLEPRTQIQTSSSNTAPKSLIITGE